MKTKYLGHQSLASNTFTFHSGDMKVCETCYDWIVANDPEKAQFFKRDSIEFSKFVKDPRRSTP